MRSNAATEFASARTRREKFASCRMRLHLTSSCGVLKLAAACSRMQRHLTSVTWSLGFWSSEGDGRLGSDPAKGDEKLRA